MGRSADLSSDALLEVSGDLIAYANPACERLLAGGAAPVRLAGRPFPEFFGQTRLDAACASPLRVLARRLDGVTLPLLASARAGPAPDEFAVRLDGVPEDAAPPGMLAQDLSELRTTRAQLHLFATALDLGSDVVLLIDAATLTYVGANKAARDFHGLTLPELLRFRPYELAAPWLSADDLGRLHDKLIACSPRALQATVPVTSRLTGETRTFEMQRQAILIDGRWIIVVRGRDATEQLRSRARVELLAKVFDLASDSIVLVDHERMEYIYANEAVCAFHGLTRDEFLQLKPWDLTALLPREEIIALYDDLVATAPEARSAVHTITSLKSGMTARALVQRQAVRIDGRWIIVLIARDVTEIERKEALIERFSHALDQIRDGVFLIDHEASAFLDVNETACRMLGYSREDLMRKVPASVIDAPPEDLRRIYREVVERSPVTQAAESRMIRSDGSRITCEVLRQAIKSGDRRVLVVTFRDITEQLQARARLQRLATALDLSSDYFMLLDHETMTYVDANEASCEFHGLTREQLRETRPWELTSPVLREEDIRRIHDEVVAAAPQPIRGVHTVTSLFSGRSVRMAIQRQAIRMEGRWMVVFIGRDITEAERSEARAARFTTALDLSADAVFLIDRATVAYLDVNQSACRLLGYGREELLRLDPRDPVPHYPAGTLERIYDEVIAQSPAIQTAEVEIVRADGTRITCEAWRQAIRSQGRWVIVITMRDITGRKEAAARQAMLAGMLDLSWDIMTLVDREDMRYLAVNEAACRYNGLTRDEFLRARPWDLYGVPRAEMEAIYDRIIAQAPGAVESTEPLRTARGGAARIYQIQRRAIRMDGRWNILVTGRDVTERQRQIARMERFATALDLGEDACFIVDRETMRYLDVNEAACRLLRSTREQLLSGWVPNQSSPELGTVDDLAAAFDEVIRVSPATVVVHYSIHRADGTVIPCEVRRQAILSGGRWVIAAMVRDISGRVQAEAEIRQRIAELERSNRELEQFAYVTSHDLSEPLRMVGSYTQLLQRRYAGQLDDDAREFMGFIVDGAQRMKRLIDDLLLYSRAGRGPARFEPLALDDALDDALANLAHAIGEAGAAVRREPLPTILGERSGMVQVFQNLIGNAIKFRRPDVPVTVSIGAERTPQGWTLSVRDNGIGIEPRYFERIFIIFQRLHSRGTYEGTGIGLAICRKVVERYGGQIEVRSVPGEGATFLIHLPKALPPAGGEAKSTKENP